MPDTPKAIYWDSCNFLSYVNEMPERVPVLEALLETSARGEIELYTSTISQVEVAFGASEQQQRVLDPDVEHSIDSLWADPKTVTVVEFHPHIVQAARGMMRYAIAQGWSLKPMDAIHLATAQWLRSVGVGVEEFHTYDGRLHRYGDIVGCQIREPYTRQPPLL